MSILIPQNGAFHRNEINLPTPPGFIKANFWAFNRDRVEAQWFSQKTGPLQVAKPEDAFHDAEK